MVKCIYLFQNLSFNEILQKLIILNSTIIQQNLEVHLQSNFTILNDSRIPF